MFNPMFLRAFVSVALVSLLAACGKQSEAASASAADKPIPVTTRTVRPVEWSDILQALGTAKARESVTLTAKVSEIVQAVHFDSGQRVAAGQTLVTLKGDAAQAALTQALATHAEAERLHRRQKELADQQLIARSQLDAQLAIRDAAAARVRQARADVSDRSVRAPFSGVLGIRQVSPGSLITANSTIATLDDISLMYIDFQVPEAALGAVQPGNAVAATSAAWPGTTFEGTVDTVDPRISLDTRAVTVRARFPNSDGKLRPGMLLDVRMFRPARQALVVPEIALVQVGRDSFLYRVKADGSVEQAPVTTGARVSGQVEIAEGIRAGDRIVIDGVGKLRPGVKVADAKPAPAGAGKG